MSATKPRRPGTTTLNAARGRKMVTFTLSPEAIRRLDSLRTALSQPASKIVDDLIMGRFSAPGPGPDASRAPGRVRRP